jgi:hypothetical protein
MATNIAVSGSNQVGRYRREISPASQRAYSAEFCGMRRPAAMRTKKEHVAGAVKEMKIGRPLAGLVLSRSVFYVNLAASLSSGAASDQSTKRLIAKQIRSRAERWATSV